MHRSFKHVQEKTVQEKIAQEKTVQEKTVQETLGCEHLVWETPEGRRILDRLSFTLGQEKTALVGDNGAGKSTLARILVGELEPTSGWVRRRGRIGWLPQGVTATDRPTRPQSDEPTRRSVAEMLGIAAQLDAMAAIENGACDEHYFEQVGDAWDVEEKAKAQLDRLGLRELDLRAPLSRLSGGEGKRVQLAGCLLLEPDLLVLDEPTNHLDSASRHLLYDVLDGFPRGLLVISHDRALLKRLERTLELSPLGLRAYGGGWDVYRRQVEIEKQAAAHRLEVASSRLGRQERAAQEAKERQASKSAGGKRAAARRGASRLEIQGAKRQAQRTVARLGVAHERRIAEARESLEAARSGVRSSASVRLKAGNVEVPSSKVLAEIDGVNMIFGERRMWPEPGISLKVIGPERLALIGDSGCGKSTLARILVGELKPHQGQARLAVSRFAWLDQQCRILPAKTPLLKGMVATNPALTTQEVYWLMDRFCLGRDAVDRRPEELSGGERMRAALACLLGIGSPPPLLVLDEPTNNLDVSTVEVLEEALAAFRGALIVISHDQCFLEAVGVERELSL